MITKVTVRNFQSLVKAEVELGVLTVILGPNDLGKSALFRAIKAAAEAASGTGFITYGQTKASVAINFADGRSLIWEKGASVNRYLTVDTTDDGASLRERVFERVGREVPSDVSALLGMSSIEFGKNLKLNLNFADQDDPPFLIPFPGGITGADVAKVLGDLTNLNLLYRAIAESEASRKRSLALVNVREQDQQNVALRLESFRDLDANERRVLSYEALVAETLDLIGQLEKLEAYRASLEAFRSEYCRIQEMATDLGPDIEAIVVVAEEAVREYNRLSQTRDHLVDLEQQVEDVDQEVTLRLAQLMDADSELASLMDSIEVCPVCERPMEPVHSH